MPCAITEGHAATFRMAAGDEKQAGALHEAATMFIHIVVTGTPGKCWVHNKVGIGAVINNIFAAEHPLLLHVQSVS